MVTQGVTTTQVGQAIAHAELAGALQAVRQSGSEAHAAGQAGELAQALKRAGVAAKAEAHDPDMLTFKE